MRPAFFALRNPRRPIGEGTVQSPSVWAVSPVSPSSASASLSAIRLPVERFGGASFRDKQRQNPCRDQGSDRDAPEKGHAEYRPEQQPRDDGRLTRHQRGAAAA